MHDTIIYIATARPGAGKTESLLMNLPAIIAAGKRIVLAVPTIVLADDIASRVAMLNLPFRIIDHRDGELVFQKLEFALSEKRDQLLICTQESIRQVPNFLFQGWSLVIDELPTVVTYPDYTLDPIELRRVLDFTEERNGQLWIKLGMEQVVKDQVSTNQADEIGTGCSTLGKSAANIFRLLLNDVDVFIDLPQANGKRHVRAVEEYCDWWSILKSADEVHLFAANVVGGEFERFAEVHGFKFKRSTFTPENGMYNSPVTIYPLMPKGQIFSKRKMEEQCGSKRLIDFILQKTLEHAGSTPLLLANKWARFQHTSGVQYVGKDCRGLNKYDQSTDAILLFGGNPSPSDQKGLEYLRAKYNRDFESAFVTSRLLEPSLQAVTRTAIRRRDNTDTVRLFVQDERVVTYLRDTYLPDAVIDWSLSEKLPTKPDGRKKQHAQYDEVMALLAAQVSVKEIARRTQVARNTIKVWRSEPLAA